MKKLAIGLASPIVIAAIVICAIPLKTVSYTVTIPYQDVESYTEINSRNLFNDTYFVLTNDYVALREFFPGEGQIYGSIVETQGWDISLYILNEENYDYWKERRVPISYTLYERRIRPSHAFDFTIADPGYYYFVLSNKDTLITYHKSVHLVASYCWEETKQRTVTKQRPETRYKKVTLLDYLRHY